MRILVVSSYYKPDGGAGASLITMLCEGLVNWGHQVTVLTSVPHYPSGKVHPEYRGKITRRSIENGVKVLRVAIPSLDRRNLVFRFVQFLIFQIETTLTGHNQEFDVFLTHTPSIEIWLPFTVFSVLRKKPTIYSVHDLYPEVGIEIGVFREQWVINAITKLETYCLRNADLVRILSKSFEPKLQALGVPASKLRLVYDWVDTDRIKPLPRTNEFTKDYKLGNRFVVLYAGNLGEVQGLNSVLEAAALLLESDRISFVLVGDGSAGEKLKEEAKRCNLTNVRFIPYQTHERMPQVFASADVSLVSLKKGAGFGALPSKTFSILASGRPIIASIDEGSDTWDLVQRANAGICIPPESPAHLARAITEMEQDEETRKRYGENGRAYVHKFHSLEFAVQAFDDMLIEAVELHLSNS